MKEIIFRAKRNGSNIWFYGSYLYYPEVRKAYIIRYNPGLIYTSEYIEIERDTLGQYSGVDDKAGVAIFEGDIVKARIESGNYESFEWPLMRVSFQRGSFCLLDRLGGVFANLSSFAPNVSFEIIGNVYDNHELLEGSEQWLDSHKA